MRNRTAVLLGIVASIVWMTVSAHAGVNRFISISPEGGVILELLIDPANAKTIYALTLAGVFKSIDAGESWTLSMDSAKALPDGSIMEQDISSLVIDPIRSSTLYAGTRTGEVMKTLDGGITWALSSRIDDRGGIEQLVVDPSRPGSVYALTRTNLWHSEDEGASWNSRSEGIPTGVHSALAIDPSKPSRLYLGTEQGLYVTNDRGQQWSRLLTGESVYRIVVDPKDSANVYIAYWGRPGTVLASSNDRGRRWTNLRVGYVLGIVVDPATSAVYSIISFHDSDQLLVTTDRGATWKPALRSLEGITTLVIDPTEAEPSRFYAASRGDLFKSENAGASWRPIHAGLTASSVSNVAVHPEQPSTLFAATESGVLKSTDSGQHWSEDKLGHGARGVVIDERNPSTLFAFGPRGTSRSVDGGESWAAVQLGTNVRGIAIDPSDSAVVYAVLADGLAKSTDAGAEWASIGVGQLPLSYYGFDGQEIAVDPKVPTTIYAAAPGGISKSMDSGSTWHTIIQWDSDFHDLVIDPKAPSTIYALTHAKLFRSDNGGQDWDLIHFRSHHGQYFTDLAIDPVETSHLYLVTSGGLMRSVSRGEQWSDYNPGLPTRHLNSVTVDPLRNVYAASSRGLFVNSKSDPLPSASRYSVSLRTHNGNFVSAERCGGSFLHANQSASGPCETFEMFDLNEGQLNDGDPVVFRSPNGAYVIAEEGGNANGSAAPVNANRAVAGSWETFVIQRSEGPGPIHSGDSISLRSASGGYVAAEHGGSNGCQCDSRLNANRPRMGMWETFVIEMH